jgi:hypothetical protein
MAAGMSPAKVATAIAVTFAPDGGRVHATNPTGIRRAVSAGVAPTNMPNVAEAKISRSTKRVEHDPESGREGVPGFDGVSDLLLG